MLALNLCVRLREENWVQSSPSRSHLVLTSSASWARLAWLNTRQLESFASELEELEPFNLEDFLLTPLTSLTPLRPRTFSSQSETS